jgi:superfamily II DNA or RNA helicase
MSGNMKLVEELWKPIRQLSPAQRSKLESKFHRALNVCHARARNPEPQYAEPLAKAEKAAVYELSQLFEQHGVSREAFCAHLRNSERLSEALKQTTGVREGTVMMGAAPGRPRSESYLALWIVAVAGAIVLLGVLSSLYF